MARGFTIVEITIAIVLLGLLGSLAAPRVLDRSALAERAAADEVRALLRTSRQVAVAQERDVCVLVSALVVSAVYTGAAGCDATRPVAGAGGQGPLRVAAPTGLAFSGDAMLRFDARGRLLPSATRRVTLGTRTWVVEPATGAVS
ncbi:MAG: prepilin-type N-terminal cleavage/methylation domain-containing protein [Rubrivivax sp.]|nr:prepilin-type N-terminal cleavage/methylation domain-containing protein [Rubrivivax sp.]